MWFSTRRLIKSIIQPTEKLAEDKSKKLWVDGHQTPQLQLHGGECQQFIVDKAFTHNVTLYPSLHTILLLAGIYSLRWCRSSNPSDFRSDHFFFTLKRKTTRIISSGSRHNGHTEFIWFGLVCQGESPSYWILTTSSRTIYIFSKLT